MKSMLMVGLLSMATATVAEAQSPKAYVQANGGFVTTTDATAGAVSGEVGFQIARNLFIVGSVGRLSNVQPSIVAPTVDASVTAATASGLSVLGDPRDSARYGIGGARFEIPHWAMATPYVSAGIGVARLTPSARFTYQSGTTLTGTTAIEGQDATQDVISDGLFTAPASSNALMVQFGAGVKIPIGPRIVGDVGYNVARISSDTPVSAQGLRFGVGFKF